MERPEAYIPIDRRHALVQGKTLPDRTQGAALFADISGFTPLTAALLQELGLKRGAEELPRQLNLVYDALITEIHRYRGSVLGFAGDAITCWLDGDDGSRAVACALALQEAMRQFEAITTPAGTVISLGLKVAVATGPVRRFQVGDPEIQLSDALAGATLEEMAAAEGLAERGEVMVTPAVLAKIGDKLKIADYRSDPDSEGQFAQVTGLTELIPPTPWPPLPLNLSQAQARSWLLPPVYDQLQSGLGEFLAEIRPAVALFLSFGGIDYDTDSEAGAKLDAYIRWVQGVLIKYESYMLQLTIGDKGCYLYTAFGAPQSHDDDPARAVAAALDIQNPPDELSFIGPVQIGISQGRMRTGAYGGLARRTYGSLGDEVNMAARLMGKAQPGEIMISRRVADVVAEIYNLQDLGLIKVKGKDEPIPVALVLGRRRTAPRRAANLFPTPLVGREVEQSRMEQILTTAEISGKGQVLRVEGVAGIGKSHLMADFTGQAIQQGWRVVLGTCQSINQTIPYHPWRQIFRAMFALFDDNMGHSDTANTRVGHTIDQVRQTVEALNPDWLVRLPLLGDLLDLPIPDNSTTAAFEPQFRQEALFTFAIDLIQHWAQAQPLLLLIEDVHWLDEASRGLIEALARVVGQSPLVLAVVQRPSLDPSQPILSDLDRLPNYHFIDLGELTPEGVAAVVANRLAGSPAPLLVDLIVIQARGNPFFVEEMTDTLCEANHLHQEGDGSWTLSASLLETLRQANCLIRDEAGQLGLNPNVPLSAADVGLPDSIQQVVLSRLDRLLEDQRLTLKVASVIGRVFEFRLLARAHPIENDQERLLRQVEIIEEREFARMEMPLPRLTHLFKHNITRDVAYETMLEQQQRDLHRAVAIAMEETMPEAVEQLAYHYTRARAPDKALLYLGLAAQKAQYEYANETALAYYEQALTMEARWEWRKGQAEVLHLLGRRQEEAEILARLAAIANAPPFEVAYLWGAYYEAIADYPQAQEVVERALTLTRQADDRYNEIRCLGQLGLIARRQGDYQTAKERYQQALADFDDQGAYSAQEAHAFAQVLNGLGIVHRQQGEFEQARLYYEQTLALSRTSGNLQLEAEALNSLGVTAFYLRQLQTATDYYQQALSIWQTIGDRAGVGKGLSNMAMAIRNAGDYDQAQTYYAETLSLHQALGNRWEEVNVWNSMGVMHQELGNLSTAQVYLEQGLTLAQEIGDEIGQAYLQCNLGLVMRDQGDLIKAEQILTEGLTVFEKTDNEYGMSFFLSYLGAVSLQAGHFEQALERAGTALSLRQKLDMRLNTTDDLATLGATYLATGDVSKALGYAEQALAILAECKGEGPEFPQQAYFICYQVLTAAGQNQQAQAALQGAYDLVMARANKITDPDLRRSFLVQVAMNQEVVEAYARLNG